MAGESSNGVAPGLDAALRERVKSLESDIDKIGRELHDIRGSMSTRRDVEALADQIRTLANEQKAGQRPNWQMWSVAVALLGLAGTVAYLPIQRDTSRLDTAVTAMLDRGVFQRQYDSDQSRIAMQMANLRSDLSQGVQQQRYNTDQDRLNHTIGDIRARQLRNEERYLMASDYAAQHGDLKSYLAAQIENLQRQITSNQQRLNEVWSARDALIDMRQRLERIERGGSR
jgi:hypothetical protein